MACCPRLEKKISIGYSDENQGKHTSINLSTENHTHVTDPGADNGTILCCVVDDFVLTAFDLFTG